MRKLAIFRFSETRSFEYTKTTCYDFFKIRYKRQS